MTRRTRGRLTISLALGLLVSLPGVAWAGAVPGATYAGTTAVGGSLTFTVSSDGTLVDSYDVSGVHGHAPNGSGCEFAGGGDAGVWPGASITNNAFTYDVGTAIDFDGVFTGAQSAAGTVRFDDPQEGASPGCDTGKVNWTAATTATPPAGGGSGSGGGSAGDSGGGDSSGTGGGKHSKPSVATRVVLRKLSAKRLGGQLTASQEPCRAVRTVFLWRGSRRLGSTRTSTGGRYTFRLPASMRGRAVRATVKKLSTRTFVCAAGSSTFIRG